ncbi:hypothetical protein Bca4012_063519 [Brassica carinata]
MESRRSCQGKEIAEETAEVEDVKEGLPERLLRWTGTQARGLFKILALRLLMGRVVNSMTTRQLVTKKKFVFEEGYSIDFQTPAKEENYNYWERMIGDNREVNIEDLVSMRDIVELPGEHVAAACGTDDFSRLKGQTRPREKFAVMEARVEEMGKEVARLTGVCEKQERELNKWKKMLKGRSATKRRRSLRKKAKRDNDQGVQLQLIIRMLAVTGFRMVQCKVTVMMLHARQERVDGLLQWVDKGTSVAGESGDVDGVRGNVYPLSYVKQDSSVDGGGGENQRTVDGLDGMEQEKLNVLVENVMKDSGGCLDLKGDEETLGGHGCGSKADAAKDEMGEQQAESVSVADAPAGQVSVADAPAGDDLERLVEKEVMGVQRNDRLSVADGGAGVEETPQEERGEIVTVSVANSTAGDDVKKVVEKEGTREERSGLLSVADGGDEGRNGNVAECAIGSKDALQCGGGGGGHDMDNQFFIDLANTTQMGHIEVLMEYSERRYRLGLQLNRAMFVAPWFTAHIQGKVRSFNAARFEMCVAGDARITKYLTKPGQKGGGRK